MAVYSNGLPYAIFVTTVNVSDRDGAVEMFAQNKDNLSMVLKGLFDGGYTGDAFARAVKLTLGSHVVAKLAKRSKLHKFAVMPKRLVVERSFAWIEKCRRLWKNCERKLHNTFAMASLAFVSLILNRF